MKKFIQEFKAFAMRGNVMDLAVGVIIGGAFKGIVDSLVNDMISPIIGLVAKRDFSHLTIQIAGVELKYGAFFTAILNFILMALVIFFFVKGINSLMRLGKKEEKEAEAVTHKTCPFCRSEISTEAVRCPHCTSMLSE